VQHCKERSKNRAGWEKSIKEAKVLILLYVPLRRRRRRRRRRGRRSRRRRRRSRRRRRRRDQCSTFTLYATCRRNPFEYH
jgi:hypothetical protein